MEMAGLTPMGLFKNKRRVANCIVAGNGRTHTNGIIKNGEVDSEILWLLEMIGLKPMGLLNIRGGSEFS